MKIIVKFSIILLSVFGPIICLKLLLSNDDDSLAENNYLISKYSRYNFANTSTSVTASLTKTDWNWIQEKYVIGKDHFEAGLYDQAQEIWDDYFYGIVILLKRADNTADLDFLYSFLCEYFVVSALRGESVNSYEFFNRCLRLSRKFEEEWDSYSTFLLAAAGKYRKSGDYLISINILSERINLIKRIGRINDLPKAYQELGVGFESLDKLDSSIFYYEKGFSLLQDSSEHDELKISLLVNLFQTNTTLRRFSEADSLRVVIEPLIKKTHYIYPVFLINSAQHYFRQNKIEKAEKLLISSITEIDPNDSTYINQINVVRAYVHFGVHYYNLGQYEKGLTQFNKASQHYKDFKLEHIETEVMIALNTVGALRHLNRIEGVKNKLISLGNKLKRNEYQNSPLFAQILNQIGLLYLESKSHSESEKLFLEANKILLKLPHSERERSSVLSNLGLLYQAQKNYKKAQINYLESIKIVDQLGLSYVDKFQPLHNLFLVSHELDNTTLSDSLFQVISKSNISFFTNQLALLSEMSKQYYLSAFYKSYSELTKYAVDRYSKNPNLINAVYNQTLVLKDSKSNPIKKVRRYIRQSNNPVLDEKLDQWQDYRVALSMVLANSDIGNTELFDNPQECISCLLQEIEKVERELLAQNLGLNLSFRTSFKDISKELAKGESAIEIIKFEEQYAALILKGSNLNHPELILLGDTEKMESEYYRDYKINLKSNMDAKSYKRYWEKIENRLEGVDRVIFSPTGIYHSLNVSGLRRELDEGFLFDSKEVEIVSSTSEILFENEYAMKIQDAVIFGAPDFSGYDQEDRWSTTASINIDSIISSRNNTLSPIPMAKLEIESVAKITREKNLKTYQIVGEQASEKNMQLVTNPGILHIATHGYFINQNSKSPNQKFGVSSLFEEQIDNISLLRSGLLLARNKQDVEMGYDGILTAYEMLNLELDSTELVVISSCFSGLGLEKVNGGVYGIGTSFKAAGARNIIMSLWEVDDEVTKELMTSFYDNWLVKDLPIKKAFFEAQRVIKDKYALPYYWAAFVMI